MNSLLAWHVCLFYRLFPIATIPSITVMRLEMSWWNMQATGLFRTCWQTLKRIIYSLLNFKNVPEIKWCNGTRCCCNPVIMTLKYFGTVCLWPELIICSCLLMCFCLFPAELEVARMSTDGNLPDLKFPQTGDQSNSIHLSANTLKQHGRNGRSPTAKCRLG